MKNKFTLFIIGTFLFTLNSCLDNFMVIRGNGILKSEFRRTQSFTKLENSTSIDVVYKVADTSGITIKADENLLEYIITETFDNTLEIKLRDGTIHLDYKEKPLITVTSPRLQSVSIAGSGTFIADEMKGDAVLVKLSGSGDISVAKLTSASLSGILSGSGSINLSNCQNVNSDIFLSGSGTYTLSGKSDGCDIKITGSGEVFALDFPVVSASVFLSGSGNAYANVSGTLTGIISGSGNIYVKGNPVISQTVSGSGRIINYK